MILAGDFAVQLLWAFLIGGAICVLGQLCFDLLKLTPAHTMSFFVVLGCILGGLGLYDKLIAFAGFGARLPIISFGNSLVKAALAGIKSDGIWGIFSGVLQNVSAGIAAAVFFAVLMAVCFKPRS